MLVIHKDYEKRDLIFTFVTGCRISLTGLLQPSLKFTCLSYVFN